jgi:hypothetical protein
VRDLYAFVEGLKVRRILVVVTRAWYLRLAAFGQEVLALRLSFLIGQPGEKLIRLQLPFGLGLGRGGFIGHIAAGTGAAVFGNVSFSVIFGGEGRFPAC